MSSENTAITEKHVWFEDKVFGYLKVQLPTNESGQPVDKLSEVPRPQDEPLKEGTLFKADDKIARVKSIDAEKKTVCAELTDGSIIEELPLKQETVITCKLTVHGRTKVVDKSVYIELNQPVYSILDQVKNVLQAEDYTFIQLFSGDKLLALESVPEKKEEPIFEIIEEKKLEEEKPQEEQAPAEEKEEPEPRPEEAPAPESVQEQPAPEIPAEQPAEEVKPEEKLAEIAETLPELQEVKPEEQPKEEEQAKPEEPPKEEERQKSTFVWLEPVQDSDEVLRLDRYKKIGEYNPAFFLNMECYMEHNEGYRFAQSFDHVLMAEDTPRSNYMTLLSISTPLILRGLGIIGPAPSIVGTPILDFTLVVANLSSGQKSFARVKKQGSSERCHFYYLEPPIMCSALDQVEITVDSKDRVVMRGRYLKVVKEDNVFFGLEGTKFSIDYQSNNMIAGICYSLLTEIH